MTKPYPFQIEDVQQVYEWKGRALLASQMGLGKTIEAIYWITKIPKRKPVIIVTPASVKYAWQAEAANFGLRAEVLEGNKPKKIKSIPCDIVILNYDILHSWLPVLLKSKPQCVILDEVNYCKNHNARRTGASHRLAWGVPSVLGLSGTPMTKRPIELWSILSIIKPDLFPDRMTYAWRYCAPKYTFWGWTFDGATNTEELHSILRSKVMIRRLKKEVAPQMPDKIRQLVPFRLSSYKEYEKATTNFMDWLTKKSPAKANKARKSQALVKVGYLLRLVVKLKLKMTEQWIKDFCESNPHKKLVCLTMHRFVIKHLSEKFPISVIVDGRVTGPKRAEAIRQFQTNGKVKLFFGNWKAAGIGITLTAAHHLVSLDFPWTPGDLLQGEDRCILEGQEVMTVDGWKKIEEIKIGDLVLGKDGLPHNVTDAWSSSARNKTMVELDLRGWPKLLRVTNDHQLLTQRGWVMAGKLNLEDRILMPDEPECGIGRLWVDVGDADRIDREFQIKKSIRANGRNMPSGKRDNARLIKLPNQIGLTLESMFVFGYYIGDGFASISSDKGRFVSFSGNKNKKVNSLNRCRDWGNLFGISGKLYLSKGEGTELRLHSGEMAKWFTRNFGRTLKTKRIPEWVFETSSELRTSFLEGLCKSDGYYRKSRQEIITVSWRLACDYSRLIMSLGHKPCINFGSTGQFSIGYTLGKEKSLSINAITVRRCKQNERVFDLTVKDSNSFVLGTSVVHNCHRIGQTQQCTIFYLYALNTIEEKLMKLLQKSALTLDAVLDGKASGDSLNIFDELISEVQSEAAGR